MAFEIKENTNLAALGTSAVNTNVPTKIIEASGSSPSGAIRSVNTIKVINTHATQTVAGKWDGTATITTYDFFIDGNTDSGLIAIPRGAQKLSLIASGSSTPVSILWGNEIKD